VLNVTLARSMPARPGLAIHLVASDALADAGYDVRLLERMGFGGKAGERLLMPSGDRDVELLVGVGPLDELSTDALRRAAVQATRGAGNSRSATLVHAHVTEGRIEPAWATQALAEGLILGSYRFTAHKSDGDGSAAATGEAAEAKKKAGARSNGAGLEKVAIVSTGDRSERDGLRRGIAIASAVLFARDLVNEPGGVLTPTVAAERISARAADVGATATVLGPEEIREERLGGLLAVNQGSDEEPRFVRLEHRPEGAEGHVALVGKGITFDSGGLSIKPADGMMTMKCDMGGAAAVAAAVCAMAELDVPVAVTAYLPFTDNMNGGSAQRPGDVYTARNGTTVEVLNTDAEGRLVLADALAWAAEETPDAIVDLATLTGACMIALGDRIAGLMGTDDDLVAELRSAAEGTGERVWPLPLPDDYRRMLDSTVADIKNIGARYGGTLTAGLFLREFTGGVPWAHLDIAGPAFGDSDWDEGPAGGTGFGVRTLVGFVEGRAAAAISEAPVG